MTTTSIPIIRLDNDLGAGRSQKEDDDTMAQSLRATCIDVGFFYLEGHDISPDLIERTLEQSRKFFSLSVASKRTIQDSVMSRGYTAMEEETLDPDHQTKGDTKEGFYMGPEISKDDDARYNPSKLAGPNCWPTPENTQLEWSTSDCHVFRSTMEEYWRSMTSLGLRVTQLLARALHLPSDYFDPYFRVNPLAFVRLLRYDTTQPSDPDRGIFACGAHSDYGMITLLLTDGQPGLQIYHKEAWIDVPPRPTCFIVNLGDMLERWSNGLFRSTRHRVVTTAAVAKSGKVRYSIRFFYEPAFDTVVDCLPTCCSDENPAKFAPITSGQHLVDKYKATHAEFQPEANPSK